MHILTVLKVVGVLLMVLGAAQLVPAGVSLLYGEDDWKFFLGSALGAAGVGGMLTVGCWNAREISIRDGFVIVTTVWVTACLAGAVPLYLTGAVPSFVDAIFESMSGFTTTGASVIVDYAPLSHGVLLWRSMSQCFGGMGIIVLAVAIMPALGIAGMQLYEREVPGPLRRIVSGATPNCRAT